MQTAPVGTLEELEKTIKIHLFMSTPLNFENLNGQSIDIDKSFGSQCYDLSVFCARQIMNNPNFTPLCYATGGVRDWSQDTASKQNWLNAGWEYTINNPNDVNQIPPDNSIFVYTSGEWGHTGVILHAIAGQNYIKILEQNAITGNGSGAGGDASTIREITYDKMDGWFSYPPYYKNLESQTTQQPMSTTNLYQELVKLNPAFAELWIQGRFNLNDDTQTAQMINEAYGWGLSKLSDTDKVKYDNVVQANKNLGDLLTQSQANLDGALKDRADLANRTNELQTKIQELESTPKTAQNPNAVPLPVEMVKDVPIVPDTVVVDDKILTVKKNLTVLEAFTKNQLPTVISVFAGLGIALNLDQTTQIITGVCTVISYALSFYLEIKNRK